jgi:hypothetical protein
VDDIDEGAGSLEIGVVARGEYLDGDRLRYIANDAVLSINNRESRPPTSADDLQESEYGHLCDACDAVVLLQTNAVVSLF